MTNEDFSSIPILDFSLSLSPETKPQLLSDLRIALVRVGFFYLKNHPISEQLQKDVLTASATFFALPMEKKVDIENVKSRHFLGYSRINSESTASKTDHNESIMIGPDVPAASPDDPTYLHLQGPSQWPEESSAPGMRQAIESYYTIMQRFSIEFTGLISEALELPKSKLVDFIGEPPFSRLKLNNYPPPFENEAATDGCQGSGPHKDGVFMTYLLQGGTHNCLEVQNKAGAWIAVPPIPGTVVANIGRLLETITHGVCTATTHRVILNSASFLGEDGTSLGPRVSVPFFQFVDPHLMPEDLHVELSPHIRGLVSEEAAVSEAESFYSGLFNGCMGDSVFVNFLTSFPRVGENWYPELLTEALRKQAESKRVDMQRLESVRA